MGKQTVGNILEMIRTSFGVVEISERGADWGIYRWRGEGSVLGEETG